MKPAYVVSLPTDVTRRQKIGHELSAANIPYDFFDAVYGQDLSVTEYFELGVSRSQRILSPSELGCSISHLNILKKLVASGHNSFVILEDDVSVRSSQLYQKFSQTKLLDNTLYILGGQEGLRRAKVLKAVRNDRHKSFNKWFSYFFQRTCCYAGTAVMFQKMMAYLDSQTPRILADDWPKIVFGSDIKRLEYWPIFSHPNDLAQSHIEQERRK